MTNLAAIEFFVHFDPSAAPDDMVSAQAKIPDALRREKVAIEELPSDWRRIDNRNLQQLGTDWARSKKSVALVVPSAAVEGEWNVLLNPAHPDFAKVAISAPSRFDTMSGCSARIQKQCRSANSEKATSKFQL